MGAAFAMAVIALFAARNAAAQAVDTTRVLKGIEDRYNRTQTLEVSFTESYTFQRRKRTENGTLYLRKPGRMRWAYSAPAGKLFVSDGEFAYYYSPQENRAEKSKLKETEDMRAPLAFLLGRLNFQNDFREFRTSPQDGGAFITALPKSDKLIYTEVSFLAMPDYAIKRMVVKGQDNSVLEFEFEGEKRNPALADTLFRFTPPAGAEYVDSTR